MSTAFEQRQDPSRARAIADAAAMKAGVEIEPVTTLDQIADVCRIFDGIWGTADGSGHLPAEVLRALVHSGNYASGSYLDGAMVGAVVGFLALDGQTTYLHSHILGVDASRHSGSIGFALKQDQRAWALEHGIDKITWTFDPLVRRNAHFNLNKLGADASAYLENFYGVMPDAINAGDETDRLLITWSLRSERAESAAKSALVEIPVADQIDPELIALDEDASGAPKMSSATGDTLLCRAPTDIVALRGRDPRLAADWRKALRDVLGGAMKDGYRVAGFTRYGWYVLDGATR
jgi:predicted GNAT superfamily acetyltransferase